MSKWNLIVDVAKCVNCNNCVLATKDEHWDNDFPGYAAPQPRHGHYWIGIERCVRGAGQMVDTAYLLTTCNHCSNAPCIKAASDGAVYQRPDGIVIIDPVKAKGRKDILRSCPYGAIWWNEELQLPQKWIFDAHLLDQGWRVPRCEQACPTGAITSLKTSDEQIQQMATEQGLRVLSPELGTRPRVYYRNLDRFDKCFLGGNTLANADERSDNVSGARVALFQQGQILAETLTDDFGDFKFDGLVPGDDPFRIEISHSKFGATTTEVSLRESCYLGSLVLGPG